MFSAGVQTFSPHLLRNYDGLVEKLMSGRETISKIETISKNPEFNQSPIKKGFYFSRWQIAWIGVIKYPLALISSVFFKAIAITLDFFHIQRGSRIFSVLSTQMVRQWQQVCDQWEVNTPLLRPAYNAHELGSWDVYAHGSIPTSFINDEDVAALTFHSALFKKGVKQALKTFYRSLEKEGKSIPLDEKRQTQEEFEKLYNKKLEKEDFAFLETRYPSAKDRIHKIYSTLMEVDAELVKHYHSVSLFSDKGLSRGASLWFINLYLKTVGKFKDPLKHLYVISEQFIAGVPRQGALLQSFANLESTLELKETHMKQNNISLFELDCDQASALNKIESLEKGIYRLGVFRDSFVYVKFSEKEGYVWNPSYGLFKANGKQLLDWTLKHNHRQGEPNSHIYFTKFEQKQINV